MAASPSVWSPSLEQLKRDWIALPSKCAVEANQLAREVANACATAVRAEHAQHWVTGNLTRNTYVSQFDKGKLVPGWRVKVGAAHGHLFERGTKKRYYVTKPGKTKGSGGKIHATGAGPAKPGFRTMAKLAPGFRRELYRRLNDMLRRQKLEVTTSG